MAVTGAEQDATTPEQAHPVTDASTTPVADPVERAVTDLDLSTPERAREFAKKYPVFQALFADERNAEKQRTLADLRRERGTTESVQAYHQRIVDETARRLEAGQPLDDLMRETPVILTAAQEQAQIVLWKNLYEQAKETDPDAVSALEPFAENPDLTAEQWRGVASAAMNAVANHSKNMGKTELLDIEDIDALPKDSKLYRAIDDKLTREREAEVTAQQIEAAKLPTPPNTPAGTVVAGGKTAEEIAAMSPQQLDAFTAGLTSDEDWDKVMTLMYAARGG